MSDGGGTEENSGTMEVSAVQTVADTSVLQKHIRKLVPLLLEDGGEAPASLETALEEKSAVEQMRKFLSDPQLHTILVERSALKGTVKTKRPDCDNVMNVMNITMQHVCNFTIKIVTSEMSLNSLLAKLTMYVSSF